MKKLFTIVFATQLMVNTIVIFYVLLIKQIHLLYVMFGLALAFQVLGVFIISIIATQKSPFVNVIHHKYLILDAKDMPKGGK
jgi:hypothetical protein